VPPTVAACRTQTGSETHGPHRSFTCGLFSQPSPLRFVLVELRVTTLVARPVLSPTSPVHAPVIDSESRFEADVASGQPLPDDLDQTMIHRSRSHSQPRYQPNHCSGLTLAHSGDSAQHARGRRSARGRAARQLRHRDIRLPRDRRARAVDFSQVVLSGWRQLGRP
jgi:hypothetical protein